ncbi:MAG: hypothetical protein ACOCV1_03075 [Bacillota bacterium]
MKVDKFYINKNKMILNPPLFFSERKTEDFNEYECIPLELKVKVPKENLCNLDKHINDVLYDFWKEVVLKKKFSTEFQEKRSYFLNKIKFITFDSTRYFAAKNQWSYLTTVLSTISNHLEKFLSTNKNEKFSDDLNLIDEFLDPCYCPICGSCGIEECCDPIKCESVGEELIGKYCERNVISYSFALNNLFDLIDKILEDYNCTCSNQGICVFCKASKLKEEL